MADLHHIWHESVLGERSLSTLGEVLPEHPQAPDMDWQGDVEEAKNNK